MTSSPPKRHLLRLFAITAVPVALLAARMLYTGQGTYRFLAWNLFLAWLPLLFAYLSLRAGRRRLTATLFALSWLLFLPNAPYIVTDLMHLHLDPAVPLLFDVVMLFTFAVSGLTLGFVSLRWMQTAVKRRAGLWASRVFVLVILALSGFGIYVGRYLRWNSWDVIANPAALTRDLMAPVVDPIANWRTWAMSMLFAALLAFIYWLWLAAPDLMQAGSVDTAAGE